jgi:hypothetical protein
MPTYVALEGWEFGDTNFRAVGPGTYLAGPVDITGSIVAPGGSQYSVRCYPSGSNIGHIHTGLTAAGANFAFGFAGQDLYHNFKMYIAEAPASASEEFFSQWGFNYQSWSTQLRLNSDRKIELYDKDKVFVESGSTVLELNTWYNIGIYLQNAPSTGIYDHEVQINGVTELTGSHQQYVAHGPAFLGKYTNYHSQSIDIYYDDYVATFDGWAPFDRTILLADVVGDGDINEFTYGTNSSNWEEINKPYSTTTYMQDTGSVTGSNSIATALFKYQNANSVGIDGKIVAIAVGHHTGGWGPDVAYTNDIGIVVKRGHDTYKFSGIGQNYGGTWHGAAMRSGKVYTTDQFGQSWKRTTFNQIQSGMQNIHLDSQQLRIYASYMQVLVLPIEGNRATLSQDGPTPITYRSGSGQNMITFRS